MSLTKKNIEYIFVLLIIFLFFNIANYYLNHTSYDELDDYYQFYNDFCNTTNSYNMTSFYCECYKVVYEIYRFNFGVFVLSFLVTFIMSCTLYETVNHINNNRNVRLTCGTLYLVFTVFYLLPLIIFALIILNCLVKENTQFDNNLCTNGIKQNFHEEFIGFKVNIAQLIVLLFVMFFDCVSGMFNKCFKTKVKEEKEPLIEIPPPYTTNS